MDWLHVSDQGQHNQTNSPKEWNGASSLAMVLLAEQHWRQNMCRCVLQGRPHLRVPATDEVGNQFLRPLPFIAMVAG